MDKKQVIIIGGGPSGLMAADVLSKQFKVTLYEKEKTVGRKFLVAGKGGFNLTSGLTGKELLQKYTPLELFKNPILNFDSSDFRNWLKELGITTFIGTSNRVFPTKDIKPITVLKKIKQHLIQKSVTFKLKHSFIGFDTNMNAKFKYNDKIITPKADYIFLGLGGASWPKTGSDGKWLKSFNNIGVATKPFEASNCGFQVIWNQQFIANHSGKPLKNIQISCGKTTIKGEALITDYGLEGNAVYPIIPQIRAQLHTSKTTKVYLDLKPFNTSDQLNNKIKNLHINPKNYKKLFNLNTVQLALIKNLTSKEDYLNPINFIKKIKHLPVMVCGLRSISESISTVGGIPLSEINSNFSLKKHPTIYVLGEMIDWDAPTGGFLIQGCMTIAHYAAKDLLINTINKYK